MLHGDAQGPATGTVRAVPALQLSVKGTSARRKWMGRGGFWSYSDQDGRAAPAHVITALQLATAASFCAAVFAASIPLPSSCAGKGSNERLASAHHRHCFRLHLVRAGVSSCGCIFDASTCSMKAVKLMSRRQWVLIGTRYPPGVVKRRKDPLCRWRSPRRLIFGIGLSPLLSGDALLASGAWRHTSSAGFSGRRVFFGV